MLRDIYVSKSIIDMAGDSNVYYSIRKHSSLVIGYQGLFLSVYSTFIVQSNQRALIVFGYITEFTPKEAESFDVQKFLIFYKFL